MKKARITVTSDGYVLDGHHTWAAAVGRDAEDGNLDNDMEMDVVIVDMPMSKVYHLAVEWTQVRVACRRRPEVRSMGQKLGTWSAVRSFVVIVRRFVYAVKTGHDSRRDDVGG